ncbi:hypothetical protein N9Z41_02765 [bacterium]|nr:hypothetical protein [bacterium]
MSDDWWATPAGVQTVLQEEIKIRNDRIEELELAVRYEADLAQQALDARKELEAKLAKALDLVDDMVEWGTWYGLALSEILQRRAELKGKK